jgi:hypothetical protein
MGDASIRDVGAVISDFLSEAHGRSFCDGCLALELHVSRLDVQSALGDRETPMDRGHGRCSICGQTLMVTRVARE